MQFVDYAHSSFSQASMWLESSLACMSPSSCILPPQPQLFPVMLILLLHVGLAGIRRDGHIPRGPGGMGGDGYMYCTDAVLCLTEEGAVAWCMEEERRLQRRCARSWSVAIFSLYGRTIAPRKVEEASILFPNFQPVCSAPSTNRKYLEQIDPFRTTTYYRHPMSVGMDLQGIDTSTSHIVVLE